jgi:hypothetical protein
MQATLTTNKTVVLFGDFRSYYVIRDAGAVTFTRLDELFALNGELRSGLSGEAEELERLALEMLAPGCS